MKKLRLWLVSFALLGMGMFAYGQTVIQQDPITGAHMVSGTLLNQIITAVNNLNGTGTAGAVAATTLTASGAITSTGTAAASCLMNATYATGGAALASNADSAFFVAPRPVRVVAVSEVHAVAAGGASVVQVVKDTGTAAPGTGTDLLTNNTNTGFDLNATANTVQVGTLVATAGVTSLAAGDRLSVDYANTLQSTVGVVVTVCLAPI